MLSTELSINTIAAEIRTKTKIKIINLLYLDTINIILKQLIKIFHKKINKKKEV
jgi:hypothetical protein